MSEEKKGAAEAEDLSLPAPKWDNPSVQVHPLNGERYTSREFFQKEFDTVWAKSWLLLGRELEYLHLGPIKLKMLGRNQS